jgi:hypothetical protein
VDVDPFAVAVDVALAGAYDPQRSVIHAGVEDLHSWHNPVSMERWSQGSGQIDSPWTRNCTPSLVLTWFAPYLRCRDHLCRRRHRLRQEQTGSLHRRPRTDQKRETA